MSTILARLVLHLLLHIRLTWKCFVCKMIRATGKIRLKEFVFVGYFPTRFFMIFSLIVFFCYFHSLGTDKIVPTYDIFEPLTSNEERDKRYKKWKMAVDRSSHSYAD